MSTTPQSIHHLLRLTSHINPELGAFVTKSMEILERYKDLVQSNYKEPTNGNFDDCTKEVLAES